MEHTQDEYAKLGAILQQRVGKNIISYELIDIIGRGCCGAVYLAQLCQHPFTCYAVKTLPISMIKKNDGICNEVQLHRLVSWHPSIVSLEFVIQARDMIYIGLEYCEGGDLYDAITVGNLTNCNDVMSEDELVNYNKALIRDELIRKVFLEILNAVYFCHTKNVYHRDLKPENILLDSKGKIKLADFGLATSNNWSREYGCGSCFYMSPEAHKPKSENNKPLAYCTSAADVWSLGIIFLNLCFGRNPWKRAVKEDPAYLEYMLNPNLLSEMFHLSDEGNFIVKSMLNINPSRRCTIKQVIDLVKKSNGFIKKPDFKKPTKVRNEIPDLGIKEFKNISTNDPNIALSSIEKLKENISKSKKSDDEGLDDASKMDCDLSNSSCTKVDSNQCISKNLNKLNLKKLNSNDSTATFMTCFTSADFSDNKSDLRQYASMAFN